MSKVKHDLTSDEQFDSRKSIQISDKLGLVRLHRSLFEDWGLSTCGIPIYLSTKADFSM